MLSLYIFPDHFISALPFLTIQGTIVIQKILLGIHWMYLSISILMINSHIGQVESLFSLPEMPFFHD